MTKIPVIDLFAGPGGLGEGFSSLFDNDNHRIFDIKLSIEKDIYAHQTLRLRSFFRQFKKGKVPEIYYDFIKENDKKTKQNLLIKLQNSFKNEWNKAEQEAWHFELPFELETKERGGKEYTPISLSLLELFENR